MATRHSTKGPSWDSIQRMEQARWKRFAEEHMHESDLCEDIVMRIKFHLQPVTQAQAAQLARLAAEHGWTIPSVGQAAAARRRKKRARHR